MSSLALEAPAVEQVAEVGPALTVVVPLYNEEENVDFAVSELLEVLDTMPQSAEVILVDDGSPDATGAMAMAWHERDPRVRVIQFRRNFGQTAAISAGFRHARGRVVVLMDGDQQNDPHDLPRLLAKMDEGYDIVTGWRHRRQDKLISRKIPSMIANRLIAAVTGIPTTDNGCSLKAYRGALIKGIPLYSEMHRFIPAMASVAGPRITEIKVRHHARRFGKSKYGLSRIYKVALDLLVIKTVTSFTSRPLQWFGILSLPVFALSAAAFCYTAWLELRTGFFALPVAGSGLVFCAGTVMLISSGALAELVYHLGDIRERNFSRLTQQTDSRRSAPARSESMPRSQE